MQVVEAEVRKSVEVARNLALAASVTLSAQHFKAELPTLDESTPLFDHSYLNGQSEDGHIPQLKNGEARQRPRRPPVPQENTLISEANLKEWEANVDAIQNKLPSNAGSKCKAAELDVSAPDADDKCEPGMPIPNSCANLCGESFIAADSNHVKASTAYFSDTGMMAILCHHDIVLFWANMWTAGKKQFFALALLAAIMAKLPSDWTLGSYMISHWDFLPEYLPQILFSVSVFHAYGHQWVCQLWYHPRKAGIWGLSDGEGHERFWSMLCRLIPVLCITGITHIHGIQLMGMAEWLQQRITKTTKHLVDAQPKLEACGHSSSFLHQQFAEQCIYQSKPITRQSKNSSIKAIEKIVTLQESASAMKVVIASLKSELMKYVLTDSITHVSVLSFESESSSSQTLNMPIVASKRKTQSHIEDAMHHHERTITRLAKKYNSMLKQMVQLRTTDTVATNAILPPAIVLKTLFKLDVDNDTWHDVGLEDLEEFGGVLPPWLSDDMVRAGIHFDQEVLNCKGELARCHTECAAMQTWFEEEYEATSFAKQYTPDADLKYHLQICLRSLGALGEMWQRKMPALVSARPWPEMVPATLFVPTHRQRLTPDDICLTPNDDLDIQSSDDDDETELEPATICDTHVMEEIDRRAREQVWEAGDSDPE
ncbi:hypothetical protein BS47DRAFT_1369373 [Hydnum rufescens UP504]|uniref:Uncharacterized protein n=1 Tax=Hydnum rufescens UP504 TaxID=1448309 RepID=A0A9P6ADF1_9AGAM|nr:hypothetical protein BS47DRAFT_1369373 [Hydnum rufescens UP504]